MNRDIVERKLESLARCVARISDRLPESAEDLAQDYDRQDIIAVNLERAIQTCVDIASHLTAAADRPIPETMREQFPALAGEKVLDHEIAVAMAKAVGLRNLAVHDYSALDWMQLHEYLPAAIADLRRFAEQISAYLGTLSE